MKSEGQNTDKSRRSADGHVHWVLRIFLLSVALSGLLSFLSEVVLGDAGYLPAIVVLLFFILLGIVFDVVGVAVTAADSAPFHSMAARRAKGAQEALTLLRSAEKVSSFCNDVVGDVCGIVSGTTAAVIVQRLHTDWNVRTLAVSIGLTALISGLTIGGKAIGKRIAINCAKDVVYAAAKVLRFFHWKR